MYFEFFSTSSPAKKFFILPISLAPILGILLMNRYDCQIFRATTICRLSALTCKFETPLVSFLIPFALSSDVESPSFGLTCPGDIKRFAERAKNYTTITWSEVEATDNSGVTPTVTVTGVRRMYYVGKHLIVYKARDEARNFKLCQFHVTIEGKSKGIVLDSSPLSEGIICFWRYIQFSLKIK